MWFEEHGSTLSGSDNSPQPSSEIPSSAVLFLINFLCHFNTVFILWQRKGLCQWNIGPSGDVIHVLTVKCASQRSKHFWMWVVAFVGLSHDLVERQTAFSCRTRGGRATRTRAAISIWSSTSGAVTTLVCQEACGELGWRSVGTTSPASLLGRGAKQMGHLVTCWHKTGAVLFLRAHVCVCVCVAPTDWATWC